MAKNLKPSPVAELSAADVASIAASIAAVADLVVVAPEPQAAPAPAPASVKSPKVANQSITLLVSANPKRGKSAPRFALYTTCLTTHEYIAAGGYSADLAWDTKREFIKLSPIA